MVVFCRGEKHLGTIVLQGETDNIKTFKIYCEEADDYELTSAARFDTLCGNAVPVSYLGSVIVRGTLEDGAKESSNNKVPEESAIAATVVSAAGFVVAYGGMMVARLYL